VLWTVENVCAVSFVIVDEYWLTHTVLYQAKIVDPGNESNFEVICPCCKRLMKEAEVAVFQEAIAALMDNDSLIETSNNNRDRTLYQSMRRAIEEKVDDLRDFKRMTNEATELEKVIKRLQDDLLHHRETLATQSDKRDREQKVVDELSELVDTIRRWAEDAGRVVDKKMEINQKVLDLKATSADSTRDLKTVDRQITEMREERDMMSAKVARLHKETSDLNNKISEISNSVRFMHEFNPLLSKVFLTRLFGLLGGQK
jgi:chromosome segregation ATPase